MKNKKAATLTHMHDNRFSAKGFLVWGVCALFFLYEFFLRTVVGTYQHPVMQDLHLDAFQFSILSTTVFLSVYGLMQVPVGLIVDRLGLKKSLLIGAATCTLATFLFAISYSYSYAILSRILMGFGASFAFVCLLVSVHDWMPAKQIAGFVGLSQFIGTMGPILAAGPLESLTEQQALDWRTLFIIFGFSGCFITLLIALFVTNNHQKQGKFIILYQPENILTGLRTLFRKKQPWLIALYATFVYFSVEYLSENEGRAFLKLNGMSATAASYTLTLSWIGYAVGSPLFGYISDRIERRRSLMILGAAIGLVAIVAIVYPNFIPLPVKFSFFCLGIAASSQSLAFASMTEQFTQKFVALGFGLTNALIMVIASINAPLIGALLDSITKGEAPSITDYQHAFSILIAIGALGLLLAFFFIKESFCKSKVSFTPLK